MYDKVLKTYADSGLRTVEDWNSLGREIASGATPRTAALHRGTLLPLFTRHQTRRRAPSSRAGQSAP